MTKLNPCAMCHKRPRQAGSAACKKCLRELQKEQIGLKPTEDICSLCGNTVPDDDNICKKCEKKVYSHYPKVSGRGRPGRKKSHYAPIRPGSSADKLFRLLKDTKGYTSVAEMVKALKLSNSTVRAILATSLRDKVTDTGNDRYKLKPQYMKDDVSQTVCDILSGAVVTEQIDRML